MNGPMVFAENPVCSSLPINDLSHYYNRVIWTLPLVINRFTYSFYWRSAIPPWLGRGLWGTLTGPREYYGGIIWSLPSVINGLRVFASTLLFHFTSHWFGSRIATRYFAHFRE